MAKEKVYYQCRLAKGNERAEGYIEERGAKVGAFVEIDELGGFWEVLAVGKPGVSSNLLHERQTMHRNHRKGSDV